MSVSWPSWTLRKRAVGALGAVALSLALLPLAAALPPSAASAAGTSTVVPLTTFTVTSSQCDGPTTSPIIAGPLGDVGSSLGEHTTIPDPISFGTVCTPPPSALSSVDTASASAAGSPGGSANVSAQALGNAVIAASANSDAGLTASIPLSSPASSIEVSIPYTTTGITWTTPNGQGCGLFAPGICAAAAAAFIDPIEAPITCADGSQGTVSPFNQSGSIVISSFSAPTPPGSGLVSNIRFSCPDGSDLVPGPGLGFTVSVADSVYSDSGQPETASANIQLQGVTATIDS
jgi:hypothetical protein